jgi:hypothetical protein
MPVETSGAKTKNTIIYKNTQYGFTFTLPKSWEGYKIIESNWKGTKVDSQNDNKEVIGSEIIIRNPSWTSENPYQDIPIMVITFEDWRLMEKGEISLGAAPIGPSELGKNSKFVFGLPPRYNFAYPRGYKEVNKIIESKPLKGID